MATLLPVPPISSPIKVFTSVSMISFNNLYKINGSNQVDTSTHMIIWPFELSAHPPWEHLPSSRHSLLPWRDKLFPPSENWSKILYTPFCLWISTEKTRQCTPKRTIHQSIGFLPSAATPKELLDTQSTESGRKYLSLFCFASKSRFWAAYHNRHILF